MIADELVIENLTEADVAAVVDLCQVALDLPEDAAEAEPIITRLLATAGQDVPGSSRPRRTVGFTARLRTNLVGVAVGSVGHDDPTVGHVDLVAVHPDSRRLGVGRALINALEPALSELGVGQVAFTGNAPYYAWPGIDVRYTPAVCLAQGLGYEHETTAWNMTVDLSEGTPAVRDTGPAEARLADMGVWVRRATAADRDPLLAFVQEHFWQSFLGEVTDSIDRPGAGCHLASRDGELLGFAAYGSSRPSWFGPMGTAPAARGLGVGALLLRRCLIDQRDAGHRTAQIGWVGPVPFYSGVAGARIERVFFLYRKHLLRAGE